MKKREAAIRLESRPPAMRFKKIGKKRIGAAAFAAAVPCLTRFGLPSCLKVLLVEDLLHQISGSLGKCELAEARIDGSEVGVEDLVESVVVLHDVSFRTTAWFLASFFLLYIVRCVAIVLFFLFFVLLLFFCCAFTIRTSVCVWHAAIVISIVKSSGYLEENVITMPA